MMVLGFIGARMSEFMEFGSSVLGSIENGRTEAEVDVPSLQNLNSLLGCFLYYLTSQLHHHCR